MSTSAEDKRRKDDEELCQFEGFRNDEGAGKALGVDSLCEGGRNRESMLSTCVFTAGRRIEK